MSHVITLGVLFLGCKQAKVIIITATANVVGASWSEEEIREKGRNQKKIRAMSQVKMQQSKDDHLITK